MQLVMSKSLYRIKHNLIKLLLLGLGAIPGTLIRWHIDNHLIVNIFGCGVLGILIGLRCNSRVMLLLGVGFCGSLTTFSGWIFNCFNLIINYQLLRGIQLIIQMLFLGTLAFGLGFVSARKLS